MEAKKSKDSQDINYQKHPYFGPHNFNIQGHLRSLPRPFLNLFIVIFLSAFSYLLLFKRTVKKCKEKNISY